MIVDFHTHVFPPEIAANREKWLRQDHLFEAMYRDPKARIATADDLLESMERSGVDVSVVMGFAWNDAATCAWHNDYILEAAARSGGRLVPFCMVQPAVGEKAMQEEIRRCARMGARGLGELRPDDQGYSIAGSDAAMTLAEQATDLDLVLLFHVTEPVGHAYPGKAGLTLADFASFVTANPGCKIVGAHWGGGLPFFALMPEVKAALETTWFDTAATRYLYDRDIYPLATSRVGGNRILFGSDFPLIGQEAALKELRDAGLEEAMTAAIAGGNAALLLGLE